MNQEIWGICVDHPPLAPLLLAGIRAMLGESTLVLRLLPAIAGAATVFLAGKIAQRLGGQLTSHVIAALAVFTVPVYGVMFGYYSMNAFEILFWVGAVYVVTVLQAKDAPRLWLLFGLLAGIGLQNKHTFVLFAGGLVLGLLLHRRSIFRSHWFWFSGHNCYWLWGPGSWSGEVMIAVNVSPEELAVVYSSVDQVAVTSCRFCVDYENNAPIVVARRLKVSLAELWSLVKHYD